jgi:hypothetical protein
VRRVLIQHCWAGILPWPGGLSWWIRYQGSWSSCLLLWVVSGKFPLFVGVMCTQNGHMSLFVLVGVCWRGWKILCWFLLHDLQSPGPVCQMRLRWSVAMLLWCWDCEWDSGTPARGQWSKFQGISTNNTSNLLPQSTNHGHLSHIQDSSSGMQMPLAENKDNYQKVIDTNKTSPPNQSLSQNS